MSKQFLSDGKKKAENVATQANGRDAICHCDDHMLVERAGSTESRSRRPKSNKQGIYCGQIQTYGKDFNDIPRELDAD